MVLLHMVMFRYCLWVNLNLRTWPHLCSRVRHLPWPTSSSNTQEQYYRGWWKYLDVLLAPAQISRIRQFHPPQNKNNPSIYCIPSSFLESKVARPVLPRTQVWSLCSRYWNSPFILRPHFNPVTHSNVCCYTFYCQSDSNLLVKKCPQEGSVVLPLLTQYSPRRHTGAQDWLSTWTVFEQKWIIFACFCGGMSAWLIHPPTVQYNK